MFKFTKPQRRPETFTVETDRLEIFSDAIIAIIMTLLVLEIHIPSLQGTGIKEGFQSLVPLWPKFVAFGFSFLTLAVIWVNHHHFFHSLKGTDKHILWHNNHLLLWVCLVPFVTAFAGEHLGEPVPTFLFGGAMFMMATSFLLMLRYAYFHSSLLPEDVSLESRKFQFHRSIYGPLAYGLGTILALFFPWISIGLYLTVLVFYFLPQSVSEAIEDMIE